MTAALEFIGSCWQLLHTNIGYSIPINPFDCLAKVCHYT